MANLKDIAEKAGVSKATVSQVLNGRYKESWPSMKERSERIRAIARQLGYRPNAAAKAILKGRFDQVMIIQDNESGRSDLPKELLTSLHDAFAERGYRVGYQRFTQGQLEGADFASRLIQEASSDGLVVNIHTVIPESLQKHVKKHRIPAVWLNSRLPRDCVRPNDHKASRSVTQRLVERGHKRIAYVDFHFTPETGRHFSRDDRLRGYRAAVKDPGLEPVEALYDRLLDHAEHVRIYRGLLSTPCRPTAIVAYSPLYSDTACTVAGGMLGLRVPDDVEFGTFCLPDECLGTPTHRMVWPFLEIGRAAAEMLVEKIDHPKKSGAASLALAVAAAILVIAVVLVWRSGGGDDTPAAQTTGAGGEPSVASHREERSAGDVWTARDSAEAPAPPRPHRVEEKGLATEEPEPVADLPVAERPDTNFNMIFGTFLMNLTVDTGAGNPGASGVALCSHNTGGVWHVTIRCGGAGGVYGLDMRQPVQGPALCRDVRIEGGFRYGVNARSFGAACLSSQNRRPEDRQDNRWLDELGEVWDVTVSLQKAIDSGATTVYLPKGLYVIRKPIVLRGRLRVLQACRSVIFAPGLKDEPMIVLAGDGAEAVWVDNLSASFKQACGRTLVIMRGGGSYIDAHGASIARFWDRSDFYTETWGTQTKSIRTKGGHRMVPLVCSAIERKPGDVELVSFRVDPPVVEQGGKCRLSWEVRNARSVSIAPGVGSVKARGSRTVTVAGPMTFVLQADGQGGPEVGQVEVVVSRPADRPAATTASLWCAYYELTNAPERLPEFAKLVPVARTGAATVDRTHARYPRSGGRPPCLQLES